MRQVRGRPSAIVGLTVIAGLLGAGCAGDDAVTDEKAEPAGAAARVYGVAEVRREFRSAGLPLIELEGAFAPRVLESRRAGPVFHVDVYPTVADAAANDGTIFYLKPASYRERGEVMTGRRGNVVVVFEEGRARVSRGVRSALVSLH